MPAQTGLTQLGDQLLRASGDYANMKVRKQREDEARAQALADLADQRQYGEAQGQRARTDRMADATKVAQFNSRFEALQRAMKLGLIAATDIGNLEVENVALKELAGREQAETTRKEEMRKRAQVRVDKNAKTAKSIMDQIADDEQTLRSRPEVDDKKLEEEKERLARLANPGKKQISKEDIEGQHNAALKILNDEAQKNWFTRTQEAKISLDNNKMLLRSLADENQQLTQMFGVIGDVPETVLRDPNAGVEQATPPESPMAKLQRERAEKLAAEKSARDAEYARLNPPGSPTDPNRSYGGVKGVVNYLGRETPNALDSLKYNFGQAVAPVSRTWDAVVGGGRGVAEGDAERAAAIQSLVQGYSERNYPAPLPVVQPSPLAQPQAPKPPKPPTYEQFLQFQEPLKNGNRPLPKLNQLRNPPLTSVFSSPGLFGSMGN